MRSVSTAEYTLVDGVAAQSLPLSDRGLSYGDGVFETLLAIDGKIPLWDLHMARLAEGCRRLGMPIPERRALESDLRLALAGQSTSVVKLIVTRGDGARGYAPELDPRLRRIVMRFRHRPSAASADGLSVHWCGTILPHDPVLAGVKHLNRLHQVFARAEVTAAAADEGLLCDPQGDVVGATAANVFALLDGKLRTPDLALGGVAGVCRAALLADPVFGPAVTVGALSRDDIAQAEEVFLTNAVRGVMPIRSIGALRLRRGPAALAAAAALARIGFVADPE